MTRQMTVSNIAIEPVLVALETIEVASDVTFAGIDLETGYRIQVSVQRDAPEPPPSLHRYQAHGLILRLEIETTPRAD